MAQEQNGNQRSTYNKSKNESVGDIAAMYAVGSAANSILKSKTNAIVATHIQYKSRVKAEVKYSYDGEKPTKEDQTNIASLVNQMITSNAKIECKTVKKEELSNANIDIPENINSNAETLYQVSISNGLSDTPYQGVSHLQLPQTLGFLKDFKFIKMNTKKGKLVVQFQIGNGSEIDADAAVTTGGQNHSAKKPNAAADKVRNEEKKSEEVINKVKRIENKGNNKDNALLEHSQDIVDKILYDLKSELKVELSESKLEQLVNDTRLILNQFQNITYTRALFAQQGMKKL